jgi:hypothetical protein
MPVLADIQIKINALEVVLALHCGRKAPPKLVEQTQTAIEQAQTLLQPQTVYKWVPVLSISGKEVILAPASLDHNAPITIGPYSYLMAEAELALISAVTIGAQMDERIRELNKSGLILESYLFDSIGVVALAKAGEAVRRIAETEADSRGWGVGDALGPGSLKGWSIEGQINLCALLPLEKINVKLNDSGVLIPFKSASGLIGIGPGYQSKKVGSVCRFCMHADTCWRRRDA